ncbi:MAG TPA: ATP-binding protein [Candidatus Wallbacteria bacterium]|nr:ATP-binding protein [Candidatus Wallbacteria bacterium]
MKNDIYYQYNPWWEENYNPNKYIARPSILDRMTKVANDNVITILTGLRRVGKTTLMKLFIKKLIEDGIKPKYIFYISLDDFLLNNKSIIEVISDFRKIQKLHLDEKVYLFLDEITYKEAFHQQLKNIFDNQKVKIFVSASSSSILKDKKAFLTGREIIIEVLPLDFNEYLEFKKIKIAKKETYLKESYFEEYLKTGGMPEYVLTEDREYLKNLIDDIIYKDIVAFHGIKNHQLIKEYFSLLMERAGKQVSINKIANILNIAPDTSKRYLQMFEDTFLINLVSRYGKTNEKLLSPKKVYVADLGIKNLFTGFRDKGSSFENYIYTKIKNQDPHYIYEDGIEIDFITSDKTLIEVKYNSDFNLKQKALFESFNAKNKIIIKNIHDVELLSK